jgi:hypothetical protein
MDVVDLLGHLVDKSLVLAEDRGDATRYRLLETIRQYAEERLEAAGEAELVRRRHAEYYAGLAAAAGAGLRGREEAAWTDRVDTELDNLRAAVAWAVGTGDADLALRLVAPLVLAGTRAGYAAGAWAASVAGVDGAEGHPLYPQVLAFAGWAAAIAGDRPGGMEICHRALGAADALAVDGRALCRVLSLAAGIAGFDYGSTELLPLAERGVEVARSVGDDFELAQALCLAWVHHWQTRDVAAAVAGSDEALAVARRLGSPSALCYALFSSGCVRIDNPALALPYLEQALAAAEQVGNPLGAGMALSLTAAVHGEQGDWVGAAPYVARSIRSYHRAGDRNGFAQQLVGVGLVLDAVRDDEGAAIVFGTRGFQQVWPRTAVADRVVAAEAGLRARLGEERFATCAARGDAMDDDELAAFAIDKLEEVTGRAASADLNLGATTFAEEAPQGKR